jgi:hypothetical protein
MIEAGLGREDLRVCVADVASSGGIVAGSSTGRSAATTCSSWAALALEVS